MLESTEYCGTAPIQSGPEISGHSIFNPLTPNDPYRGRTAPLTSKVSFYIFIQQI